MRAGNAIEAIGNPGAYEFPLVWHWRGHDGVLQRRAFGARVRGAAGWVARRNGKSLDDSRTGFGPSRHGTRCAQHEGRSSVMDSEYDDRDLEGPLAEGSARWPMSWQGLYPRERWLWFQQLWSDVCMLRPRYRLPVSSGWWENQVQVEALAALAAWVARYDSGEWGDDPPGKLALLYDLERVAGLLRDGDAPFVPDRDRLAFARHLMEIGCQLPPAADQ